jgi:hypothetical protein
MQAFPAPVKGIGADRGDRFRHHARRLPERRGSIRFFAPEIGPARWCPGCRSQAEVGAPECNFRNHLFGV